MTHPPDDKSPRTEKRTNIADLLQVARGYEMLPRTRYESQAPNFGLCIHCANQFSAHDHEGKVWEPGMAADEVQPPLCPPKFALVNEKLKQGHSLHVILAKDYTRDDLIMLIGSAYPEFVSLVKEITIAKAQVEEAQNTCRVLYESITKKKVADATEGWEKEIGDTASALHQSFDVLRTIVHNTPPEKAKEVAEKWLKRIEDQMAERKQILVNEKGKRKGLPQFTILGADGNPVSSDDASKN